MSGIITGTKIVTVNSTVNGEDKPSSLLFDQTSTKTVSHFVHLPPGKVLSLSTFGLPDGAEIQVHKVILGGGKMPQGTGCLCGAEDGESLSAVVTEQLHINCRPVALTNCTTINLLNLPGSYVFVLNDEAHLGKFYMIAEEFECTCLPEALVIGNFTPEFGEITPVG